MMKLRFLPITALAAAMALSGCDRESYDPVGPIPDDHPETVTLRTEVRTAADSLVTTGEWRLSTDNASWYKSGDAITVPYSTNQVTVVCRADGYENGVLDGIALTKNADLDCLLDKNPPASPEFITLKVRVFDVTTGNALPGSNVWIGEQEVKRSPVDIKTPPSNTTTTVTAWHEGYNSDNLAVTLDKDAVLKIGLQPLPEVGVVIDTVTVTDTTEVQLPPDTIVVTDTVIVEVPSEPAVCTNPDWRRDLSGDILTSKKAQVVHNHSNSGCSYDVGYDAWEVHEDNNLASQTLFAQKTGVIRPGQTLVFEFDHAPTCKVEEHLFVGAPASSLANDPYKDRLLDVAYFNSGQLCGATRSNLTETFNPPIGISFDQNKTLVTWDLPTDPVGYDSRMSVQFTGSNQFKLVARVVSTGQEFLLLNVAAEDTSVQVPLNTLEELYRLGPFKVVAVFTGDRGDGSSYISKIHLEYPGKQQ
jgi:hypothetical protein